MYGIILKVDDKLPWIELEGEFQTKSEAKQAAQRAKNRIAVKIVRIPQERRKLEALVSVGAKH